MEAYERKLDMIDYPPGDGARLVVWHSDAESRVHTIMDHLRAMQAHLASI